MFGSSLKRARLLFDEIYPDGPPAGILTVNRKETKKRQKKTKQPGKSQQSASLLAVSGNEQMTDKFEDGSHSSNSQQ